MLFECLPFALLTIKSPNSFLVGVDYKFDLSEKSKLLFEKYYEDKIIIDEVFKQNY